MAGNTGSQEAPKGVCPQQLVLELFRTLGDGKYDDPEPFCSGTYALRTQNGDTGIGDK